MMNFKFSLFRMFMAVTAFCGAFGFVKWIGAPWPICPWLIGVPLAGVMLLVKWEDKGPILYAIITCMAGLFVGVIWASGSLDSGPVGVFNEGTIGVILGWWTGLFYRASHRSFRSPKASALTEKDLSDLTTDQAESSEHPHQRSITHDQAGTYTD